MKDLEKKIQKLTDELEKDRKVSLILMVLDHEDEQSLVSYSVNNPSNEYCCDFQVFSMLRGVILAHGGKTNHYCCTRCFFEDFNRFMNDFGFEEKDSDGSMLAEKSEIKLN